MMGDLLVARRPCPMEGAFVVTASVRPGSDASTEAQDRPVTRDVLDHLRRLRRSVFPALAFAVVVGVVTYVVASNQDPVFEATGTAWVQTGAAEGSEADAAIRAELTASAVALSDDRAVLEDVIRSSGQDWTATQAADRITVARDPASGAVSIRVLGPSPQAAHDVADEVVDVLDERIGAEQADEVEVLVDDLRDQATDLETQLSALPEGSPARSGLQQD